MFDKFFKLTVFFIFVVSFPISIYADDEDENISENIPVLSSEIVEEPRINARHAVVLDRNSRCSIYEKKSTEICKMASTTKIMTAIVIIENAKLDDMVTISPKSAGTGGSRLGLSKNDKITVKNLLYGLMLKSGNDAAVALAEYFSRKFK